MSDYPTNLTDNHLQFIDFFLDVQKKSHKITPLQKAN